MVDLASADYVEWQVYGDGTTVCPRCLTPSDRQDGGSQLLTEGENDAVLRDLDPDNEAG
ncbi:hypothetical protein ACFQ34_02560 [Pseudonocardia benzenivorans]|uniref:Uncharacterized protein n=1 Tax=Pseudonocardia benzenivorans TaxID=228005 RepID=A0ABW3VC44_9PSEU